MLLAVKRLWCLTQCDTNVFFALFWAGLVKLYTRGGGHENLSCCAIYLHRSGPQPTREGEFPQTAPVSQGRKPELFLPQLPNTSSPCGRSSLQTLLNSLKLKEQLRDNNSTKVSYLKLQWLDSQMVGLLFQTCPASLVKPSLLHNFLHIQTTNQTSGSWIRLPFRCYYKPPGHLFPLSFSSSLFVIGSFHRDVADQNAWVRISGSRNHIIKAVGYWRTMGLAVVCLNSSDTPPRI